MDQDRSIALSGAFDRKGGFVSCVGGGGWRGETLGDEDGSADSKTISLTTLIHRETFHQICVVALSLLLSTPVTAVVLVIVI